LIALAYFSIPVILYYLIRRTKNNLPFLRVFWLFLLFILACGVTHVFDAVMFWDPVYRASAFVLFITAVVSWMAVIGLYRVIPLALSLKSPIMLERIIQERTEELARSNAYLLKSNLELEESRKSTEKLMKQKDEFLNVASHELKTPITSLKAYTQILSTNGAEIGDERTKMYAKMNVQINKLTVLINDLLDTTKLQEGMLVYDKARMSLSDTLMEVTEEMARTTKGQVILLKENIPSEIVGDKDRITQVINNFLTNAVKYSRGNDKIIVRLTRQNNMAVCSVQDFGIGIPNDQHDKIFQKFYRVTGRNLETYPGMGLGLFIVKDIVERHNGKVWFESKEDEGSTFYFSIPVAE
jgi:two-component system, chemotaxis family, sensor kinase Cph1